MQRIKIMVSMIFLLFFSVSCSVMSRQVREQSLQSVSFQALMNTPNAYIGDTVILGGYIFATTNKADNTVLQIIQAPLTFRDYPASKDRSAGRFLVVTNGLLDPEIYKKDRRITVAGIIVGLQIENIGQCPYGCLKLESREIYLWPEYDESVYWKDDPYYFYRGYPYDSYFYYRYPYERYRLPTYGHPFRRYPYYRQSLPTYHKPYGRYPYSR